MQHLERALDRNPEHADALTAYEQAAAREPRRLERQYRKLIHRLGDRAVELRVRLWWSLAGLYERLGDATSAKVVHEILARLAPEDPRLQTPPAPPASGAESEVLAEAWRRDPADGASGRALFQSLHDAQRWDEALAAAGALLARGQADATQTEYHRRYRPRFLVRAAQPLSPQLIDRLRDPEDDRDLARLFAHAFAACPAPLALGDFGVTPADRVATDMLPAPFAAVLSYLAAQLGVPAPPVFRRDELGRAVVAAPVELPALIAGPQALAETHRVALGFRLARALVLLAPGRAEAVSLSGRQLKVVLLATLALAQPGLKLDDPDGQVAALRAKLATSPSLAREVAPLVEKLLRGPQGTLNLSRYARGLSRSADRVALVLTGDVELGARLAAESAQVPDAAPALVAFALGASYHAAREALGLTISV
jgi:hypothetical protein